jgi:hypothetical protein
MNVLFDQRNVIVIDAGSAFLDIIKIITIMEHITITVSADGRKCHLKPESGYMLQRGVCPNLYSEADGVKNTQRELSQWRAVAV